MPIQELVLENPMNQQTSTIQEYKEVARERCEMLIAKLPTIKIDGEPLGTDEYLFMRPDDMPDELREVYSKVYREIQDMYGYTIDEFLLCCMITDAGVDRLLFRFERQN